MQSGVDGHGPSRCVHRRTSRDAGGGLQRSAPRRLGVPDVFVVGSLVEVAAERSVVWSSNAARSFGRPESVGLTSAIGERPTRSCGRSTSGSLVRPGSVGFVGAAGERRVRWCGPASVGFVGAGRRVSGSLVRPGSVGFVRASREGRVRWCGRECQGRSCGQRMGARSAVEGDRVRYRGTDRGRFGSLVRRAGGLASSAARRLGGSGFGRALGRPGGVVTEAIATYVPEAGFGRCRRSGRRRS
jgi:hypothetical protein